MKLAGSTWGASANTLRSSALALCYSAAEYLRPSVVTLCSHKSGRCAVELYHASHLWYPWSLSTIMLLWHSFLLLLLLLLPSVLHLSHGFQCSPTLNRQPYEGRLPLTSWWRKSSNMTVGQSSLISLAHQKLLRLTSRKPLWLDLQPVDIKSRWRYNWKSAQVINSRLVCDPTIRQPGFDLPRQQWSLLNRFRAEQGHCGACRRKFNGDLQTLICVLVARPRRCLTLSNPVPWQNWMAAYLCHTLWMKTLFRGWPIMVNDTHTKRRRSGPPIFWSDRYFDKSQIDYIQKKLQLQKYLCIHFSNGKSVTTTA